jgi:galactonate dehydratase
MRISGVRTFLVGNPWKNWLFVRVDTDEGIHGVGEGTLNRLSATVATAIGELEDAYLGQDPVDIELLLQRMTRDVYTEGGQIHGAAVAAIEVACWDILGKVAGRPVHELMGGRVRDRIRAYANGWYRVERTPEAFAEAARVVVGRGYTALKFDPFGAAWRMQEAPEEDLSLDIVAAVREAVGPSVDILIEGHNRFSVSTALRIADRLAAHHPAWFEEPVAHQNIGSMVEVARRSPVPIATGESFTSPQQFAELLRHDAVHILQPEPLFLGGLWRTRQVAAMVDAHYGVVAPHNSQGPVCAAISAHLGACVPNFYLQEMFDEFNVSWTRDIVDRPVLPVDGHVEVPRSPGLGIDLDWDRLAGHPYERANALHLFTPGWERRSDPTASDVATASAAADPDDEARAVDP